MILKKHVNVKFVFYVTAKMNSVSGPVQDTV